MSCQRLLVVLLLITSPGVFAQVPSSRPSIDALVQVLREGDESAKEAIVVRFSGLPPGMVDDRGIRALSEELDKLTEESIQRGILIAKGRAPANRSGEYDSLVTDVLAQQRNPIAIPVLVRNVARGYSSFEALVQFGEAAVPALVAGCRVDRGLNRHIRMGLDALEQMLERPAIAAPLSQNSRAQIRAVARERMANPVGEPDILDPDGRLGDPYVLAAAAYLAVATGDPDLRREATALIDNSVTVFQARRIDAGWIPRVTVLIQQALAKFPAKP